MNVNHSELKEEQFEASITTTTKENNQKYNLLHPYHSPALHIVFLFNPHVSSAK